MSGRPYILGETNWGVVRETDYEVAVLPWGATEAHNFHLPYATDVVQCDFMCGEAARLAWDAGSRVVVLPTIPFGVNTGQIDVKLDINLNPSTQLAILNDIVEVLDHQGISKLVIVNGHGANDFKQMVRELWPRYDLFLCCLDWFRWIDCSLFKQVGDHAGELETSLMQYFAPDWVLPLNRAGDGKECRFKIKALREGLAWTQRDWIQATADTGVGDPSASTAEKGEKCWRQVTGKMAEFFTQLAAADVDDLYE